MKSIKLKDVLPDYDCHIIYRCSDPVDNNADLYIGGSFWNNDTKRLVSLDDDNYSIDDVIEKHRLDDDILTVWIEVEWL